MTLSLKWEGIEICISHKSNWLNTGYDHIEVQADCALPITETGYKSHFIPAQELTLFEGPKDFVRQWLIKEETPKFWEALEQSKQLTLF